VWVNAVGENWGGRRGPSGIADGGLALSLCLISNLAVFCALNIHSVRAESLLVFYCLCSRFLFRNDTQLQFPRHAHTAHTPLPGNPGSIIQYGTQIRGEITLFTKCTGNKISHSRTSVPTAESVTGLLRTQASSSLRPGWSVQGQLSTINRLSVVNSCPLAVVVQEHQHSSTHRQEEQTIDPFQ